MTGRALFIRALLLAPLAVFALPARAVPAFARKYGTSCLTCHTVFPKLTPFGEAFRRGGYRFPGVDSDYVKQDTVVMGQEASKKTFPASVWPGTLPASAPIAIGVLGAANAYPDKTATIPRANNGTQFAFDGLVSEGQLFVGAALSDTVTIFAEVSIADGGAEVEHARVFFSDLIGPKNALNLAVGKGSPSLSSFGPHSSYAGGREMAIAPVTAIYGVSGDPFDLGGNYQGLELNGIVGGRFRYAVGLSNGANAAGGTFSSENWYAAAGYKLGGMRFDGEGSTGPADAMRPWAEDALTLNAFAYHSNERFDVGGPAHSVSFTLGAGVRGQLGSAELDLGYYRQSHDHGTATLGKVDADVLYAEASYVVHPWLVPFLRVQRISLSPSGGTSVSDLHFLPGVAILIRPNIRLLVAGNIESASGFPQDAAGALLPWQGGSGDTGSLVIAPKDPAGPANSKQQEFSSLTFVFAWAI